MTPDSFRRSNCRLCGSTRLEVALPMVPTPIADDWVGADRVGEPQQVFPLDLHLCRECGHVQLLEVVSPELLFRNYTYRTAVSLGLVEHFRRLADRLLEGLEPGSLVCEIGSNDGSMLRFFRERGLRVLGIDPATEIARQASAAGIETLPEFFTAETGARLRDERGPAAVVIANNVFAHADGLGGVADGVRTLLDRDGVFVFEVSYLVDIVERMLFDTVYHEHLCYHTVRPLQRFFADHGLELVDVERLPVKGGSIRGTVQCAGGPRRPTPALAELIRLEERGGYARPETFDAFASRIAQAKRDLLETLARLGGEARGCAGYGASATVTTLLYQFDLGGRLDFLVDDNAVKQGTFSPGHHLPVFEPRALLERRPAHTVILAWAYAEPICSRNAAYREQGGKFVVPLPAIRIV